MGAAPHYRAILQAFNVAIERAHRTGRPLHEQLDLWNRKLAMVAHLQRVGVRGTSSSLHRPVSQ